MPESVLLNACEAIREGSTAIVFANDESARKMFRKNGKKEEEIRDFIPIGCYEPSHHGEGALLQHERCAGSGVADSAPHVQS